MDHVMLLSGKPVSPASTGEQLSFNVSRSWPEIPQYDISFPAPCPRCSVIYSDSVEYNRVIISELEQEVQAHMWDNDE